MLDGGVAARLPRFYTMGHRCAYFATRLARTEFLGEHAEHSANAYSSLAPLGFRRAGDTLYRPQCDGCADCVPMRVLTREFRPRRRFRRILARNADVEVRTRGVLVDDERYLLFDRYIRARHADGSMFPPSRPQFAGLFSEWADTCTIDAYLDDVLIASAVTDVLADGLAAAYTFFEPDLAARSLGTFSILQQVEECRRRDLPYLYLGYWVLGAAKMEYKTDFLPAEVLRGGRWHAMRRVAVNPAHSATR